MEEIISVYHDAIKRVQPRGPYAIAGYSLGATLAFEITKVMEANNDSVRFLAAIEHAPHFKAWARSNDWYEAALSISFFMGLIQKEYVLSIEDLRKKSHDDALDHIFSVADPARVEDVGMTRKRLDNWAHLADQLVATGREYDPSGSVASLDLFVEDPSLADIWSFNHETLLKWKEFTNSFQYHEVGGKHETLLLPPNVHGFQKLFQKILKERASKKKSFSLIAQLSLLTGVSGNSSFSSTRDEGISYRARTMHSEWFVPSRGFVSAAVAQPDVAGFLALQSSKRPIYMVTGVRHVTGFIASSRLGEERTRDNGVNADGTALRVPLAVSVNAKREVGAGETVEWECEGPAVFVYQLEKLTRRNGEWGQKEYTKGAFMGIGEVVKDEWVVDGDSGILDGLDEDEIEVMEDGWDDLEEEASVVVVPRV